MKPHDVLRKTELRQKLFFNEPPTWAYEWVDMPDYTHKHLKPWRTLQVHFHDEDEIKEFCEKTGHSISPKTKFVWYKGEMVTDETGHRHVGAIPRNPQYPVYIISKGRWETRLTAKALEEIDVPYHIVIESQEYKEYSKVIDPSKILKLPFSNLGQGSIPARNWVWDHAVKSGAERHWILDDNIRSFYRYQDNRKIRVGDGTVFAVAENFVDRYENVALAGFQYHMFVVRKEGRIPPYFQNTRIYSCILIKNDLRVRKDYTESFADDPAMEKLRWRGRYNEDTDLSLRVLKDGHCTILFNAFLAEKQATMRMKGGNTDELYQDEGEGSGRLKMAEALQELHPDVVSITQKWGRAQHQVNYNIFKRNKLIRRPDAKVLSAKEARIELKPRRSSR